MVERLRTASSPLRRLFGFVAHRRRDMALVLAVVLVSGVAETAPIAIAKVFVEQVLIGQGEAGGDDLGVLFVKGGQALLDAVGSATEDTRIAALVLTLLLLLVVGVVGAFASYARIYLGRRLSAAVVSDLRSAFVRQIMALPLSFYGRRKTGDLISRFANDIQLTYRGVSLVLLVALPQPVVIVGAACAALWLNARLALASFLLLPVLAALAVLVGRRIRKRSAKSLASLGDSLEAMSQTLSGLRVIKAFQAEEEALGRFERVNHRWFRRQVAVGTSKATARAVLELVYAITLVGVMGLGGYLVIEGTWGLNAGTFLSFLLALATMYRPIRRLGRAYGEIQEAGSAAGRIFEVLDAPGEPQDRPSAEDIGPIREGLRFDRVSFSYEDGDDGPVDVLHEVSFDVPAGKTVALVGPSGAGKSTLADLILRFHSPRAGRILVDGVPLDTIRRESFLRQVAVVEQSPFLFNATVRENIAYGRPDVTQEDIERAARLAHIHEDILGLPDGYDTILGERGETLSGGQRQRITIARAILKGASLLLLDEATSSLDSASERAVQAALEELLKGRTALVIAHRMSTIEHADHIVVLEGGRVVEQGSPEILLKQGGLFAHLYELGQGS
ncbi:MAG TPA: ABC transporter ATP-binding protein [Planctomycetes bacterium]|nr:ABC transporter ATP-binding protein [Planctomycetota bacterium]